MVFVNILSDIDLLPFLVILIHWVLSQSYSQYLSMKENQPVLLSQNLGTLPRILRILSLCLSSFWGLSNGWVKSLFNYVLLFGSTTNCSFVWTFEECYRFDPRTSQGLGVPTLRAVEIHAVENSGMTYSRPFMYTIPHSHCSVSIDLASCESCSTVVNTTGVKNHL